MVVLCGSAANAASPSEQQREQFIQAEQALIAGDQATYQQLYRQLHDYPLRPYLDYQDLKKRLHEVSASEIRDFLNAHAGTPLADLLRRYWLNRQAKLGNWQTYLDFYAPQSSVKRQCYRLRALLETGQRAKAIAGVEQIWLHGRSQPSACDPAFEAWQQAGYRTNELNWQRIALAMEQGQLRLARYLGKGFDQDDATWLKRWITLYRDPNQALQHQNFKASHPYREAMLAQAVLRLARRDGLQALELWQQIADRHPFSADQRYQLGRRIALALETEPDPKAYAFVLAQVPKAQDERLQTARLRAILSRQDWPGLIADQTNWPKSLASQERWQYWLARAQQATGSNQEALDGYTRLARQRSYYGFLAADQAGLDYHLAHKPTPVDDAERLAVQQNPGIRRALELHALDRDTEARREWRYATQRSSVTQLKAAATLAQAADWHDQAIFTLARTGYWDDLMLRFPLRHQDLIAQQAIEHQLDKSWIYAVIRQESAFRPNARSPAGAMGLMQLMPNTAKHVARHTLGVKTPRRAALLQPDTNIALGSAYLRELLNRLADNPVLATAAYNAGPNRVDSWLPDQQLAADIWIELIPFQETHTYLRRVFYYSVIYDKRLGRTPIRLSQRMQPVDRRDERLAAN